MVNVRVSPSGPDLENSGGAPFDPGVGARLRLAEAVSTIGSTTNVITTVAQVIGVVLAATPGAPQQPMSASLALPNVEKRYRAELECDVMSTLTNANITVTLTMQTSPDGVTWTDRVFNEHLLNFNTPGTGGARTIKLVDTSRVGTQFGVNLNDAQLAVRGTIKASGAGGICGTDAVETGVGSAHILLEEMF